jgi:hypothetical protein
LWSVNIKVSEHELATDSPPPSESAREKRERQVLLTIKREERTSLQFIGTALQTWCFKRPLRAEGWRVQPAVEQFLHGVCVCVCMYVCACVRVCACVCVYERMCDTYVRMYVRALVCMHACLSDVAQPLLNHARSVSLYYMPSLILSSLHLNTNPKPSLLTTCPLSFSLHYT